VPDIESLLDHGCNGLQASPVGSKSSKFWIVLKKLGSDTVIYQQAAIYDQKLKLSQDERIFNQELFEVEVSTICDYIILYIYLE
jgi:hypothetical protein